MTATAVPITAVQTHPIPHGSRGRVNPPITSRRIAMSMITTISGIDTTPFSTAD